mgnify:CR=1 FL=1
MRRPRREGIDLDIETRIELITRVPTEEVITLQELRQLLETNDKPVAYDGFEPSGFAHIPFAVLRAIKLKDMLDAGCRFKLLLADWHAMINKKMGGDLEKIRKVGEYLIEVWKASGIDVNKVEIVWANDVAADKDYWKLVISVAKEATLKRFLRCLPIMGRQEGELQEAAQLFYPAMQVADIFYLGVDICQLGLDQRRANMLAREIAPKLGFPKPVAVHHHMLMGLTGPVGAKGLDDDSEIDVQISSKMSKSVPETSIYVHDSREVLEEKIMKAYCPPKDTKSNPIIEYCKYIIFPKLGKLYIERPQKYGGDVLYEDFEHLKKDYELGHIHPLDLKRAVVVALDKILEPIRTYFETNRRAKELFETISRYEITR